MTTDTTEVLYKFKLNCGRMGRLDSLFVATRPQVEAVIGKTIDFGEALGKHSDISFVLTAEHLTEITEDQGFISLFMELGLTLGRNVLGYVREEEENDE